MVAQAQRPSPTPIPQTGFRRQVFEPSSDDPLSKQVLIISRDPRTSYDRFTDTTTIWIPYDELEVSRHHDLSIMAFFAYSGKDASTPESMGISFQSTPHDFSSRLERNKLYVLADSERLALGRPSARSSKTDFKYINTTTEWLDYKTTFQILKKIAYAQKVEMRLGQYEFDLNQGFLQSMQKLISRIPEPKPAPPIKHRSARNKL
jgi:hypothetical protein